jgi:hypothetical protein
MDALASSSHHKEQWQAATPGATAEHVDTENRDNRRGGGLICCRTWRGRIVTAVVLAVVLAIALGTYFGTRNASKPSPGATSFSTRIGTISGTMAPMAGGFNSNGQLILAFSGSVEKFSRELTREWTVSTPEVMFHKLYPVGADSVIGIGSKPDASGTSPDGYLTFITGGNIVWEKRTADAGPDSALYLLVSDSTITVQYRMQASANGTPYVMVVQYDMNGNELWSVPLQGSNDPAGFVPTGLRQGANSAHVDVFFVNSLSVKIHTYDAQGTLVTSSSLLSEASESSLTAGLTPGPDRSFALYVRSEPNNVRKNIEAYDAQGTQKWSIRSQGFVSQGHFDADGIFYGVEMGDLLAIDETGTILFKESLNLGVSAWVSWMGTDPVGGQQVVVGATAGGPSATIFVGSLNDDGTVIGAAEFAASLSPISPPPGPPPGPPSMSPRPSTQVIPSPSVSPSISATPTPTPSNPPTPSASPSPAWYSRIMGERNQDFAPSDLACHADTQLVATGIDNRNNLGYEPYIWNSTASTFNLLLDIIPGSVGSYVTKIGELNGLSYWYTPDGLLPYSLFYAYDGVTFSNVTNVLNPNLEYVVKLASVSQGRLVMVLKARTQSDGGDLYTWVPGDTAPTLQFDLCRSQFLAPFVKPFTQLLDGNLYTCIVDFSCPAHPIDGLRCFDSNFTLYEEFRPFQDGQSAWEIVEVMDSPTGNSLLIGRFTTLEWEIGRLVNRTVEPWFLNFQNGGGDEIPGDLVEHNGKVYMRAKRRFVENVGSELYSFDPTVGNSSFSLIGDINRGVNAGVPGPLTSCGGTLYFVGKSWTGSGNVVIKANFL